MARWLTYADDGSHAPGWPAADLSESEVRERAAERGLTVDAYLIEALGLQATGGQSYYTLTPEAPAVDVAAAPVPTSATPAPKRKG